MMVIYYIILKRFAESLLPNMVVNGDSQESNMEKAGIMLTLKQHQLSRRRHKSHGVQHSMQSAHFRSVRQALTVPLTFVKRGCWQAVIGVMGLQHYLCPQSVSLPLSVFLNILSNRTPPTVYASKWLCYQVYGIKDRNEI